MHHAYRQRVHLFLDLPWGERRGADDNDSGGGGGSNGGGPGCRSIVVNATIFLPIPEGAFVDADNPLLTRDQVAGNRAEGAHCGM